ncbi:hypothetical protein MKL09_25490 [Methylobacterium sp. J-048]|uniref:hypothetical protein n=1 Tax=Methylobacterium sp. J-048 TaxID=2836635 RepID=UPI001FBBEDC7|nr:hypothetical protein [Methylobacterium sp. J-048]MCJ2059872.1 hypothetical protein [Methylobacterium sp. J-048]
MSANFAVRAIDDAMELYRRVHPDQVVPDKNTGQLRPSSAAFKDPSMSVDVADFMRDDGFDWSWSLRNYSGWSLVGLTAAHARAKQQEVQHTPITTDPTNPYHAEVIGKKTPGTANHLRDSSAWVHVEPKIVNKI